MTKHILFIQGAGGFEEDKKLANSLQAHLGSDYQVHFPAMPDENNPKYPVWKEAIAQELAKLDGPLILGGHSLGASLMLRYVAEEKIAQPITGLFLVATPFWDANDPDLAEYALADDFASHLPKNLPIFFYHSRGDEWVPFEHMAMYADKLPNATTRDFDGRGHQFNDDLSEVAADIKALKA